MQSLNFMTNMGSINAQRNLQSNEKVMNRSMARLSSGYRITMAADDAAGLFISEKLRAHIRGLSQAQRNANDGVSMLQTAEGAMNEIANILIRMRELGVQSANGTFGTLERASIHQEFNQLREEINRIAQVTEFAGLSLINGSLSGGVTFQVGIMNTSNDQISLSIAAATAAALNITSTLSLSAASMAKQALTNIDSAIKDLSSKRGKIGATQNRLLLTINNLSTMYENLTAANSRIRDTDIAAESAEFTRGQILMQSGIAMLSQANQLPSMALSLIQ